MEDDGVMSGRRGEFDHVEGNRVGRPGELITGRGRKAEAVMRLRIQLLDLVIEKVLRFANLRWLGRCPFAGGA